MFESSEQFLLFDYFRVPYRVAGEMRDGQSAALDCVRVSGKSDEPILMWPRWKDVENGRRRRPALAKLESGAVVCARLATDDEARAWLPKTWDAAEPLRGCGDDRPPAHIWRNDQGDVFLPFAPNESMTNIWSEAYQGGDAVTLRGRLQTAAMRTYYRVRPALPRAVQIAARRGFAHVQARRLFPRWPVEQGLHALYDFLFAELTRLAGTEVPRIAAWPNGFRWALVLTHDVETAVGYENIGRLRAIEEAMGYRSSWNLVPRRYAISDQVVADLHSAGFEVGVHGLYHDGRDLESEETLRERLPEIRAYAERWQAVGFRSPATHRRWDLMPMLGFDYDSSYPDTDPFEPQSGGCCTWFPFANRDLVELPITLPQDHTLFTILRRDNASDWLTKAERIRAAGGMALLITHPDYMLDGPGPVAYERFLAEYRADATAWKALPKDVSAWWRRRAASTIERTAEWTIGGPAEGEGRIDFAGP